MKIFLLYILVLLPFATLSQNDTYKVVCDKTDNKLKVVKVENRSSNFVPIKSGFPFAAVARDWIKENYSTDDCDAEQIIEDINNQTQTQDQQPTIDQQSTNASVDYSTPLLPQYDTKPKFRNTSFGLGLLFHNLDEIMNLENNKLGFSFNFEQLIGKSNGYGGFGFHFDVYVAENNGDNIELRMFKFPLFGGYRIVKKRTFLAFEGGLFINTKLTHFGDDVESLQGKVPKNTSFSIFPRVRFGGKAVQIDLSAEIWLSEVFEDTDKLSVYYLGLRFFF